jgi:hypothetical protein
MKKIKVRLIPDEESPAGDMLAEYDLSKMRVRRLGPQRQQDRHWVRIDADLASDFPDEQAVNSGLRLLKEVATKLTPVVAANQDQPAARKS